MPLTYLQKTIYGATLPEKRLFKALDWDKDRSYCKYDAENYRG